MEADPTIDYICNNNSLFTMYFPRRVFFNLEFTTVSPTSETSVIYNFYIYMCFFLKKNLKFTGPER